MRRLTPDEQLDLLVLVIVAVVAVVWFLLFRDLSLPL